MAAETVASAALSYLDRTSHPVVCYSPKLISLGAVWAGRNPLSYTLPLFLVELILIVLLTRAVAVVLQPLCLPRFISEIIGGIILGPSVLGKVAHFGEIVFPLRSMLVLEVIAHLGLIYCIFIVGVEIDLDSIRRRGRSFVYAGASIAVPFAIGAISGCFLEEPHATPSNRSAYLTFLGISLSCTAFSVLARTLAELKLVSTPIGETAIAAAMLTDSCSWILLTIAVTLTKTEKDKTSFSVTLWTLLSGITLFAVCHAFVRPAVKWVGKRMPEGEDMEDLHASLLLVGVMVAAFAGDAIGIHAISGAFIYGLVMPTGPVSAALVEKMEDIAEGMLLPVFFAVSGLRTDLFSIIHPSYAVFLVLVVLVSCAAKVAMCLLVSVFYEMPLREGFAIGVLMNTKGIIELIMLNIARDKNVMNDETFAIMVTMTVVVTVALRPVLEGIAKTQRQNTEEYNRRTLQWSGPPSSELRVLVCVHTTRNVPAMVGLLDATYPSKRSPLSVFALHLVELTGRASAMLVVHNHHARSKDASTSGRVYPQSEHIVSAFSSFAQQSSGLTLQTLTAVSPYPTMHEDICVVAEDNRVALIVLPFHKQQTVDGGMEVTNPAISSLNQSVLASAPCSVAVLVDRGLGGAVRLAAGGGQHANHHAVVIFIGGADDREALLLASRMAENPGVSLFVLRLVYTGAESPGSEREAALGGDNERRLDDQCVSDFRLRLASDESLVYKEVEASSAEDLVAAIRSVDSIHNLYIVGRGEGRDSPLLAGLTEWSECPELGPVGDFLASSDFAATVSVLVVQQGTAGDLAAYDNEGLNSFPRTPGASEMDGASLRSNMDRRGDV